MKQMKCDRESDVETKNGWGLWFDVGSIVSNRSYTHTHMLGEMSCTRWWDCVYDCVFIVPYTFAYGSVMLLVKAGVRLLSHISPNAKSI